MESNFKSNEKKSFENDDVLLSKFLIYLGRLVVGGKTLYVFLMTKKSFAIKNVSWANEYIFGQERYKEAWHGHQEESQLFVELGKESYDISRNVRRNKEIVIKVDWYLRYKKRNVGIFRGS